MRARAHGLVSDGRRTRTIRDEAGIIAKFGVPPDLIPDYPGPRGRQRGRLSRRAALGRNIHCRRAREVRSS